MTQHIIDLVAQKLEAGLRLTDADALALFESPELTEIGRLADGVNRKKNADVVFFNVNRHINPTNICALSCKFCAYSRKPGEEGGYAYTIDEMVTKAAEAVAQGATEVHMVGGLHPRWKYDYYRDMIAAVKTAFPQIHIKAFTAVELDWLARRARKSIKETLEDLRSVGLGSLPGGGAEIFHPEIRDAICDTKVSAEQWIDTHRTAHNLGMHSNCTMLYGHIERYEHRVDHMRRLRELQDETHGFNAFIPLAFQPFQNEMGIDRYTFGYDDLKTIAIARLYLDNFKHLKAYWVMLGQDVAQIALNYGANDLDGTILEEKISRMAGGRSGMAMERGFLESMIRKAGRIPCERDTLYRAIGTPTGTAHGTEQDLAAAQALVTKAEIGDTLEASELAILAATLPIAELSRLALATREATAHAGEGSYAPTVVVSWRPGATPGELVSAVAKEIDEARDRFQSAPHGISLDLCVDGDHEAADPSQLTSACFALKHTYPDLELSLWGFKALWRVATAAEVDPSEIFQRLAEAGVDAVESSPRESERDLTTSELFDLHRAAHAAQLVTIAKLELDAPENGAGAPFWERFARRAQVLSELAEARGDAGGLLGLAVTVSSGSFVTATEYLRAIAIARLAARGVPLIIAPLAEIPTVSPARGLGTAKTQHPAEKFAALALHHGAADLGAIDCAKLSPLAVPTEIAAAGLKPTLRDVRLARSAPGTAVTLALGKIRHVPGLRLPC